MKQPNPPISGVGLGLRRDLLDTLEVQIPGSIEFMEAAPENWMGLGGRLRDSLERVVEQVPLICHGLSLNLGGYSPLDQQFLKELRQFLDLYQIPVYSEHLSYCGDHGHLYDLMPIPFTEEAVRYVVERIRQVEDALERPLVLENISYYAAPGQQMSELEFIQAVLEESGCEMLLDVNNIYVNSVNHRYDPAQFLSELSDRKISYIHVAGHYHEAEDLIVDTHGAAVEDPVWALLQQAYGQFGAVPTLLERDFNIPALEELLAEMAQIRQYQQAVNNSAEEFADVA